MEVRDSELIRKIRKLKKDKKAIILAHNYQRPEIQDLADYVGDSIELSRRAMEEREAKIIVFSAVDFMAESAYILNPEKKVLLPSLGARCPMAQMLPANILRSWKRKYPSVPVVLYVNTYAEAKAQCDICCTSANALKIVEALDSDRVLFGPDRNLAWYVQQKTEKEVIPIPEKGFCPTHTLIEREEIGFLKEDYGDYVVMVHPECPPETQRIADFVGSTSQMCRYAKNVDAKGFIVGTEVGILHRLRRENPAKSFLPAYEGAVCPNMKINTLEKVYLALRDEKYQVKLSPAIVKKAYVSLKRMFEIVS